MPGSALDDQCLKGKEARLPAGSKETGSYNKVGINWVPFCPQVGPCLSGILLHLQKGLKGTPGIPNKISAHPDGRGQKAQNKPKQQRLRNKQQTGVLIKSLSQSPLAGPQGLPKNTLPSESFFL